MNQALTLPATAFVYVVESDAAVRDALRVLLSAHGIRVETFPDATRFLAQTPAPGRRCLVTNSNLPDMSGLALMARLRKRGILIPTIFLASNNDVSLVVQAMRAGAADCIEKPFVGPLLLSRVRQILGGTVGAPYT